MSVITAATLNSTTCPPWCRRADHTREPANCHVSGEIELSGDVGLYLFDLPGEGVTAKLWGPDGEVNLRVTDIARLAEVFGTVTAAALNQQH